LPFKLHLRLDSERQTTIRESLPPGTRIEPGFDGRHASVVDAPKDDDPFGTATLLLSDYLESSLEQVVVEGAPGQGKSTLAQYICQVHRIRWLNKTSDARKLVDRHKATPLRIPIKADFRDLAAWIAGGDPFALADDSASNVDNKSLEAFLARLITHASGGIVFSVADLIALSKIAPLMIVIDGLDEVADIKRRAEVVAVVSKAIPRMRANCLGLRVIITSRPAAFANSPGFERDEFPHLQLDYVTRSQIDLYARKWMDARHVLQSDRAEFESVLKQKLDEPHVRDLAKNPMQLAILLSLLHRMGVALPDKRTQLYDSYINHFFERESVKDSAVRQHKDLLKDIHKYLAWMLHNAAEVGRKSSSGRITQTDLRDLLEDYLGREHHDPAILNDIFRATAERIVMLVSRIQGTYEFEVQPLREYFAARYLYDTAPYSPPGGERAGTKPDRLNAIARNFYWLNVVRFFCGCYSKGELLDLSHQVIELINDPALGQTRHPVMLAAMLLSDWVFSQRPVAVQQVAASLSSSDSLLRFSPASAASRTDQLIQIPLSCGGAQITNSVFNILDLPSTKPDFAGRLAAIARATETKSGILDRWLTGASSLSTLGVPKWLRNGQKLGCLREAPKEAICRSLGDGSLSRPTISALSSEGRYDCIFTSSENSRVFDEFFQTALPGELDIDTVTGPVFLLPAFLHMQNLWVYAHRTYFFEHILSAVQSFRQTYLEDAQFSFSEDLSLAKHCYAFSKAFAEFFDPEQTSTPAVVDLERLINDLAAKLGDPPITISLANSICFVTRKGRPKTGQPSIYDSSVGICDRFRFARSQAKNIQWWRESFSNCEAAFSPQSLLFHLALWSHASDSVVFELQEKIGEYLEDLNDSDWRQLLRFVAFAQRRRYNMHMGVDKQPIPFAIKSKRLALLLARRYSPRFGDQIYSQHLATWHDDAYALAEYRQHHAIEMAFRDDLAWDDALAVVRETYGQGVTSRPDSMYYERRRNKIPSNVAKAILAAPADYPLYLWDAAEIVVSSSAGRSIRTVNSIARQEKWFD
jgi:hypothetical protein